MLDRNSHQAYLVGAHGAAKWKTCHRYRLERAGNVLPTRSKSDIDCRRWNMIQEGRYARISKDVHRDIGDEGGRLGGTDEERIIYCVMWPAGAVSSSGDCRSAWTGAGGQGRARPSEIRASDDVEIVDTINRTRFLRVDAEPVKSSKDSVKIEIPPLAPNTADLI